MTIKDYSSADITFKDRIAYTPEAEGRPAEQFKGCLMLPETHMNQAQKDTLQKVTNPEIRTQIKCCWYLGSTLTEKEKPELAAKNNLPVGSDGTVYCRYTTLLRATSYSQSC